MRIAVLIPVCSRNQPWTVLEDSFLFQAALPSLARTQSPGYEYTYYIGIDDDDSFFLDNRDRVPGIHVLLTGCQHAPATAWNQLFERALQDGHDYYFQMADDVVIETPGWTERFVAALQENGNRGVVGPCHPENYHGRLARGQQYCIENAFVHKTHWDIFRFFYPPEIKNWYCDDWITQVYSGTLSLMMEDVIVRNLSIRTPQQRYEVAVPRWKELIQEHRWKTFRGCFSFCLFGEFTTKYYSGLAKNVELIREYFPRWDIHVYAAPEAVEFVKGLNVTCIETGREGRANTLLRFQTALDTSYDVVCVRDTDSRVHARDRWCIRAFIESPFSLYTIRDHPWHRYKIMCGLWGIKRGRPLFTQDELTHACSTTDFEYTSDSRFLNTHLPLHELLVYSYDAHGLLGDPGETVVVVQHPIEKDEFCGNVALFDTDGNEYPEFTAQT